MKKLQYHFLQSVQEDGTAILLCKSIPWSEANEAIAKAEAHNGEYTIEDDGAPEVAQPTQEERLVAVEAALRNIPELITAAIKSALGG